MPRRVQDIVPGDRRTIRNITNPRLEKKDEETPEPPKVKKLEREVPIRRMPITIPSEIPKEKKKKNVRMSKWPIIVVGFVVILAGAGFAVSTLFAKATFRIIPKTVPVAINGSYIAQSIAANGTLVYEILSLSDTATTSVPATSGSKISTKAQGTVTIYNLYSKTPVRLIAGTRISDDTGRIYRLNSSINVPGYTTSAGSTLPGTIKTAVTADQPGESYNISRTDSISDFKVVAYKGTSKYEAIYGRLATDVKGGFVGTKKNVSPALVASTSAELKTKLTQTLRERVKENVPDGYILYDNAHVVSFSEPTVGGDSPNEAVVSVKGTISGTMFKKSDLIKRLAGDQAEGEFGNRAYEALGLEDLDVAISNPKDFSPQKKNTLILRIKGNISLVGIIPVDEIKQKLAGAPLSETESLLTPYSQVIKTGSGELIPPWSKVPTDIDRISIIIEEN